MTKENQDEFNVLRKVDSKTRVYPKGTAKELGLVLGKLNYCLNALKEKGLVKFLILKIIQIKLVIFMCLHQKE